MTRTLSRAITVSSLVLMVVLALLPWVAVAEDADALDEQLVGAIASGDPGRVKTLLDKEVDTDTRERSGVTPLMMASYLGDIEAVNALLDKGAEANVRDEHGLTPLMIASHRGHVAVVRALLKSGARVNARDGNGVTALMMAALQRHVRVVKALLDNGADANATNRWGKTALAIASDKGDAEIAQILSASTGNSAKRATTIATIKVIVLLVGLGVLTRMGRGQPFEQPFFQSQKWTLNDAYGIVIPLLALVYLQFLLQDAQSRSASALSLIFGLLYCITIYGCYYFLIKRVYRTGAHSFGLERRKFISSGVRHANIAILLIVLLIITGTNLPAPSFENSDTHINSAVFVYLTAVVLAVLVSPVLEELLFRGILYAPVARRTGTLMAVGILSVLGGVWHLHHTNVQIVRDILVFVLLYGFYIRSTSLYGPIIWHVTFNFISARSDIAAALSGYVAGSTLEKYYFYTFLFVLLVINLYWLQTVLRKSGFHHKRTTNSAVRRR